MSVVILLRDCSEMDIANFLNKIVLRYKYWIESQVLQIIKLPHNSKISTNDKSGRYWEEFTSHSPAYIKNAKSLIKYIAFLWKFSVSQSDYFIQFTDHTTVHGDLLLPLLTSVKNWTIARWLWVENFRGLMTGRIYRTESIAELVELFNIFANQMPANLILKFCERNFRISRGAHRLPEPLPIRERFQFNADNPDAEVTTSLDPVGNVSIQDLYNSRKGFFWAWTPIKGDYILIDFKTFITIKRVLIETGTYLYEDVLPGGTISVLFRDKPMATSSRPNCHEIGKFQIIAEIREPSVEISDKNLSFSAIGCIKINVSPVRSPVFESWIIFRTFAIFTN